jgi:hypothetical protein
LTPSARDPRNSQSNLADKGPQGSDSGATEGLKKLQGQRLSLESVVLDIGEEDFAELHLFWVGKRLSGKPSEVEIKASVLDRMSDEEVVSARVTGMGQRLLSIFDVLLKSPRHELPLSELSMKRELAYLSTYDLEASLAVLQRHALIAASHSTEMMRYGTRAFAIPFDLAESILRSRRASRRGVFDVFALRGHLDRLYGNPQAKVKHSASRRREFYKMYSNEAQCVARIDRLPDGLRGLVEKVLLEFGGMLTKDMFERMEHDLPHWNARRWGKLLEDLMVGTVERLDLGRYGVHHNDETLILFNEVALAWLKRVAVPGDPDAPKEEASLGVDLVSNISRFMGYILNHDVRFTVRGEIFKTTEKRIIQELIPNPGRELAREEILTFIYSFARHQHLIETTGERTLTFSSVGREWEARCLEEKFKSLLQFALEERDLGGEFFHQVRMREIYIRLLKRIEVGVWYDLMYLPFLARNTYLSNLDELAVEDYFHSTGGAQDAPREDLQRMAWNLSSWVRKRLYLLGLVDMGYDGHGRPVAMRLTRMGGRLLGVPMEAAPNSAIGNLIITPDFEVVLFPSGDDAELIHDLDRFCSREKSDDVLHFRIQEKGVARALAEGMFLERIKMTLMDNSRTPVPQNVLFSIRSWANQIGLMQLNAKHELSCEDPGRMEKFMSDPGVKPYVSSRLDNGNVKLKNRSTPKRLQSLLRDLGFLVELTSK